MIKRVVSSMCVVTLLCGPALADRQASPRSSIQLGLRVDAAKESRHYGLIVLDGNCGSIESKSQLASKLDTVKVCAYGAGVNVVLEVEWETHDGSNEIHCKSSALVARGASLELDGGVAKLIVSL